MPEGRDLLTNSAYVGKFFLFLLYAGGGDT